MNIVAEREVPAAAASMRILALPPEHSAETMMRIALKRNWLGESTIADSPGLERLPWYRAAERIIDATVLFSVDGEQCRLVPGERALTDSLQLRLTILEADTGFCRQERQQIDYGITTAADEDGEIGLARTLDSSFRVMAEILMDGFGYTRERAVQLVRSASEVNPDRAAQEHAGDNVPERMRQALA